MGPHSRVPFRKRASDLGQVPYFEEVAEKLLDLHLWVYALTTRCQPEKQHLKLFSLNPKAMEMKGCNASTYDSGLGFHAAIGFSR